jgi:hypothetical protein
MHLLVRPICTRASATSVAARASTLPAPPAKTAAMAIRPRMSFMIWLPGQNLTDMSISRINYANIDFIDYSEMPKQI